MGENELCHYGILGMKWGVRRYQNEDGTLTEEGKKRVSKLYAKAVTKKNKLESKVRSAEVAYNKAQVKTNTGSSLKYQKLQAKADRLHAKALKKRNSWFASPSSVKEAEDRAYAAQLKAERFMYKYQTKVASEMSKKGKYMKSVVKAEKWVDAMDEVFTNDLLTQLGAGEDE